MMYGYVYSTILVNSMNAILFCTYTINLNIQCLALINTYIHIYNTLHVCNTILYVYV